MLRRILLLSVTSLLFACAGYHNVTRERMAALPEHYSQFDLQMAWDTTIVGGKTVVEGIVKNVRYQSMYDLEIRIAALDAAGKAVAHGITFVIPSRLGLDETADFTVKLPVAVMPGTKLRFTYRYRGSDADEFGGGLEGGVNWFQSFDTMVPGR